MSVLTVEIPDAVRAAIDAAACRERKSPEQIAGESLARVVEAQQQLDYLAERARNGRREDFDAFLAKVPDVPPLPNDKL
jgi:predicted transcriptional regulator